MRVFAPLQSTHPLIGQQCPACGVKFVVDDRTTLVMLGPGNDPEEQMKARAGRAYIGVGAPVHAACAGLDIPDAQA